MKCCSYSPNGRSEINKKPLTSQLNANVLCFTPCQQVVYSTGGKHTTVEKRYMLHQSSFTVETCIFANIFWNIIYLWGRAHLKRLKNHINHSLGCEHVSSNHSCILGRLEDGPRRDDDIDGCEATLNMGKERWSKKQPEWITIGPRPRKLQPTFKPRVIQSESGAPRTGFSPDWGGCPVQPCSAGSR